MLGSSLENAAITWRYWLGLLGKPSWQSGFALVVWPRWAPIVTTLDTRPFARPGCYVLLGEVVGCGACLLVMHVGGCAVVFQPPCSHRCHSLALDTLMFFHRSSGVVTASLAKIGLALTSASVYTRYRSIRRCLTFIPLVKKYKRATLECLTQVSVSFGASAVCGKACISAAER